MLIGILESDLKTAVDLRDECLVEHMIKCYMYMFGFSVSDIHYDIIFYEIVSYSSVKSLLYKFRGRLA